MGRTTGCSKWDRKINENIPTKLKIYSMTDYVKHCTENSRRHVKK
jgi:hypothetical protein